MNTAKDHADFLSAVVANIVRKLGQENRHAATVFAMRLACRLRRDSK